MVAESLTWAEFVCRRLSTPSTCLCSFCAASLRTPGCRYDCLARGLMAPKEEDIKDVCHAPLLSETSGCELFSRVLSPLLIRT